MEAMGWDYWTYLAQPADLIDEIEVRLTKRIQADNDRNKAEQIKNKRMARRR